MVALALISAFSAKEDPFSSGSSIL
jgi:hypothetical protein